MPVCAAETEDPSIADNPYRLVDIYCSQIARDVLGKDQLKALVDLTVTAIEPQAVNLLIESFPCFKDAAANDELGREIGLYIYYGMILVQYRPRLLRRIKLPPLISTESSNKTP